MGSAAPIRQLLGSTRGEILTLVCSGPRTIADLSGRLGVTANAVRAHLVALERDGLVRRGEARGGVGKPAHVYEATRGGRGLLSHAYEPALGAVLDALVERMPPEEVEAVLRRAGSRLGNAHAAGGGDLVSRIGVALRVLETLGSVARLEEADGSGEHVIRGQCCPLAELVSDHPQVCSMLEAMLEKIVGAPVRERCDRGEAPSCRFLVGGGAGST